ncbi:ferrous iron transport protein A [bacterium]|nr:ferrous iron transport protein A [bacterium]
MNNEKQLTLKDIPMGNRVEIVGYANIDKEYRQKLFSLGLIRGEVLRVTKKAPLGDPIEVCLNGSKVSLRKEEANELIVELREPCGRHGHGGRHPHGHGGGEKRRGFGWGRFFHK